MKKLNEKDVEYRFDGVSGPKYLIRGPFVDIGMVVLMPGEDFNTHFTQKLRRIF